MASGENESRRDLALVRQVLEGDEAALGRFIERMRCVPRILSALNARRGGPLGSHDLADAVQDVLTIAWRKLGGYEGRATLEGWVYGLCHRELMNATRRRARSAEELDPDARDALAAPAEERGVDVEAIHRGIDLLGEPSSSVVRLKHFEGLTFDEIAQQLALSPNTAKTRYYRALEVLNAHLSARREGDPHERARG